MAVRRRLREVDLAPSVVPYLTPLLMTPRTKLGPDDEPITGLADVDADELEFVISGLDDVLQLRGQGAGSVERSPARRGEEVLAALDGEGGRAKLRASAREESPRSAARP